MQQLKAFDPRTVLESETAVTKVKAAIAGLTPDDLRGKYPAAAGLLEWVEGIVQECEILAITRSKEAEVGRLQRQLDQETQNLQETRRKLDALTAEMSKADSLPSPERRQPESPMRVVQKEGSIDISTKKSESPSRREAARADILKRQLAETR